jgi:hypothetical protein
MSPNKEAFPRQPLRGRAFPFHQMRFYFRCMTGGAFVSVYMIPYVRNAYAYDNAPLNSRIGVAVVEALALVWTCGSAGSFLKYRSLAREAYDISMLDSGGGRAGRWLNRLKLLLTGSSLAAGAAMGLAGKNYATNPNTFVVSPWLAAAFYLCGMGALVLAGYLSQSEFSSSEAARLEEARGLSEDVKRLEIAATEVSEPVINSLSEAISQRIIDLQRLYGEVDDVQRQNELIRGEVTSAVQSLMIDAVHVNSRRDLRRQWIFLLVSFVLGFVVNWLSQPALDFFRGAHF